MRSVRSRQGARLRPGTFALALLLVVPLAFGGCIDRGGRGDDAASPGAPSPDLGRSADRLEPTATSALPPEQASAGSPADPSSTTRAPAPTTNSSSRTTTSTAEEASRATAAPPSSAVISSQRDPADVAGPGYADLRALAVERIGSRLRITVEVGAEVPTLLRPTETVGLGIDFSRKGSSESEAQVFLDGGGSGWKAYLQTQDGFVDYPGTFAIGGGRLVLELPSDALPTPLPAVISAFLDWSTKDPTASSTSDSLPDDGLLKPTP